MNKKIEPSEAKGETPLTDDLDLSDLAASLSEEFAGPEEEFLAEAEAATESRLVMPSGSDGEKNTRAADAGLLDLEDILEDSAFSEDAIAWEDGELLEDERVSEGVDALSPEAAEQDIMDLSEADLASDADGVLDLSSIGPFAEDDDGVIDLAAGVEEDEALDLSQAEELLDLDLDTVTELELADIGDMMDEVESVTAAEAPTELDKVAEAFIPSPGETFDLTESLLLDEGDDLEDVFALETEAFDDEFPTLSRPATGFEGTGAGAPVSEPENSQDDLTDALESVGFAETVDQEFEGTDSLDDFAAMLGAEVAAGLPEETETSGMTRKDFEETLERVVTRVFTEKVDAVLVEVIEQTVSRELSALKSALFAESEGKGGAGG